MKTGNKLPLTYDQVLKMLDALYWDVRRVEAAVGTYVNQQGISWDDIGDVFEMSGQNAQKRYKFHDPQSEARRRKGRRGPRKKA